ncbi:efflux RND transporter permease subunit [Marinitoga aeolica]|uniref:MMPL family transporter n=1 Tax=Marinitoga aeolica TaxID=2809031 RepID=A0ABY8PP92_9BACT|nr:efflux RND transporter permease subunit [Marinitoga aeolica]WGS64459.1 MMPL family transporter [Marinitoga aeolica]
MKKLGNFVIQYSKSTLIFIIGITIISIILITKLEIKPGFLDLLPSDDPYVKTYEEATKSFKSVDSIIIGIEGSKENIIKYIEYISKKLKNVDYIDAIYYKNPIDFISKNIFLLSSDEEQKFLKKLYTSSNLVDFFNALNMMFEESDNRHKVTEQDKKRFEYMIESFNKLLISMKNEDIGMVKDEFLNMLFGEKYMLSKDGNFGMIVIRPTISSNDINKVVKLVNSIENIVKKNAGTYNVKAGLTGTLVIARDEMVVSDRDMAVATTVSLILILIIFILGFRSFRYMILSVIPLILGILWALGFTKITIGSLNIMTIMMGAILAGLGIDYSIHIISLYIELRNKNFSKIDALKGVFEKNVRGIIAGALTTAIGMGIFAISSFPGFREFGIALSSGIIFTLLAAIFGLTALLKKFGTKYKDPGNAFIIDYNIKKYRSISIAVLVILILLSFFKIKNVEFDKNMMNIEAKGLESIKLNEKILEEFEFSPDNTVFISRNLDEAKVLYDKLKNLKIFSQIDSISLFLPETDSQIARLRNAYEAKNTKIVNKKLDQKKLKAEINKLNFNLTKTALSINLMGYKNLAEKLKDIVKSGVLIQIANKKTENILKLQNIIIPLINDLKKGLNSTELISIEKIPEEIKSNYLGKDGKVLTTAYSNGDMWNADYQKEYFNQLNKLNLKNVSGTALIFLRVIQVSAREGKKILLLTIIFIFIILLLDMKSLKYAIIALLPMIISIILVLGVMGWFDIKFNVVNIIALPLIIGIGVDDGIHLIHRYRRENDLRTALKSTGKAITMTTLTTGAAFGSFILAKYRGFVGFGLLLLLGVTFSYLITVFIVTSILSYMEEDK